MPHPDRSRENSRNTAYNSVMRSGARQRSGPAVADVPAASDCLENAEILSESPRMPLGVDLRLRWASPLLKPRVPAPDQTIGALLRWPSATRGAALEALVRNESPAQASMEDDASAGQTSPIVHASPQMREILALVGRVASGDAKVLITGESGVGKDLVAREIHGRSARASRSFIAVNCAGLTETLLESELFGHVKGSFTGAYRDKPGKLQLAHRGTLVPRRSRRDEPAHAGAAPALPRERRDPVGRRGPHQVHRRRARRGRDQSQPLRHGRQRPVPRGPAVPPPRDPHPRAAACGSARKTSACSCNSW